MWSKQLCLSRLTDGGGDVPLEGVEWTASFNFNTVMLDHWEAFCILKEAKNTQWLKIMSEPEKIYFKQKSLLQLHSYFHSFVLISISGNNFVLSRLTNVG